MSGAGTPPSVLPAPIPFGNYHLLERINTGGMAEVFKAKSYGVEGFERIVAVKRILPNVAANTEFIRMFIDEAKLAGQLSHSNIAQIFDLGRADGMHYIAMEYVPGRDLRTVWKQARSLGHRLPIDLVCHIVLKACEGLDYAHNKTDSTGSPLEIVHRDVSPQNVLLSWEGEVKLIDFGLAKAASSSAETRVGVLKGKLAYMSPEQVRGISLDRRTDIFSLGIVLWELLTGERLFLGESDFETLEKVRKVEVAPPGLYDPSIPPELEDIVLRALQKNPNHRFQSAGEFQYALQKYLFANDLAPGPRDIASLMSDFFAEEIAEERRIMEAFQKLRIGSPHVVLENAEDLAWGDEESETQVFAKRSPPARVAAPTAASWADEDEDDDLLDAPSTLPEPTEPSAPSEVSAVPPRTPTSAPILPPPRRSGSAPAVRPTARESSAVSTAAALAAPPPSRPVLASGSSASAVAAPTVAAAPRSSGLTWLLAAAIVGVVVLLLFVALGRSTGGSLELTIQPNDVTVRVLVDGSEAQRGAGTVLLSPVEPGTRLVRLEADGHQPVERRVLISRGETARVPVQIAASAALAWELTTVPPGATVRVGSEERGVTPLTLQGLVEGQAYALVLTLDGYLPETRNFTWRAGLEPLSLSLSPIPANPDAGTAAPDATTPPVAETPPPAPTLHPIRIVSTPAGASFVLVAPDGTSAATGTAPHTTDPLPAGEYTVRFTLEGHQETSTTLQHGESDETTARGRLRASTPATEPAAERTSSRDRDTVAAREPTTRTPREAREPAPSETTARADRTPTETRPPVADGPPGTLSVQSRPAAMVSIDGREIGYTPIVRHSLPPGRYRIDLRNPDFGLDRSMRVVIESGQERTIINRPE